MLDKIEGLYKRAIHADPANANNFSNFGLFLAEVSGWYFLSLAGGQRAVYGLAGNLD